MECEKNCQLLEIIETQKKIIDKLEKIDEKIFYPAGLIQTQDKLEIRIVELEKERSERKESKTKLYWMMLGVILSSPVLSWLVSHFHI